MLRASDPAHRQALRVAGLYVLISVVWIAFSDRVADRLVSADSLSAVQTTKGIVFVLATAGLLYVLTRAAIRQTRRAEGGERVASELLQAVVESAPLAVVVTTLDGFVLMWNLGAEAILGWTAADVVGKPVPNLTERERSQFLTSPRRQSGVIARRRTREGRLVELEVATAPLLDEAGEPWAIVGIARDITLERQLAEQVQSAETFDAVGRLAGGVAHDVNNLMTVILGHAELLRLESPGAAGDLGQIEPAARRATDLARKLLAFSGRQAPAETILDLNDAVRAAVELMEGALGAGRKVDVDLADGLPAVRLDGEAIERILVNLVLNARDATAEGGGICVRTRLEHDAIVVEVEDEGSGMEPLTVGRAFEPYFTTKAATGGTGLGLASVYGLVRQAGGSIELDSEPGRGTRVSIRFPAVGRISTPGVRVLVVEDEDQLRQLVCTILVRDGFECVEARDADEAEERFVEDERIMLVLTDVVMPGRSGYELADRLRELRPGVDVVFMSGYAHVDAPPQGTLLEKPFLPHALLQTVRAAVGAQTGNGR